MGNSMIYSQMFQGITTHTRSKGYQIPLESKISFSGQSINEITLYEIRFIIMRIIFRLEDNGNSIRMIFDLLQITSRYNKDAAIFLMPVPAIGSLGSKELA